MKRLSRREFLGFGTAMAGAGVVGSSGLDALAQPASRTVVQLTDGVPER